MKAQSQQRVLWYRPRATPRPGRQPPGQLDRWRGPVPVVTEGSSWPPPEHRRASAGVGDQGLARAEFQGEGLSQEPYQVRLDLLGFGLRPGESQDVIICVPGSRTALTDILNDGLPTSS